ncbi:MAG: P27 family phage terminase small subunit [Vicinamibacterales bacterium]
MSSPDQPDMLDGAGLALWRKLQDECEFDAHEEVIAIELCRTVMQCEQMQRQLIDEGMVVEGQRGAKVNPIAAELRQYRILVARLTATLGIPPSEGDDRTTKPRGAVRGVYTPQVARS